MIINGGEYASWDDKFHLRQQLNLGEDSVGTHLADTLKGGDFCGIPSLVNIMVENAPATLNWMVDEGGLAIRKLVNRTGGHSGYRTKTCAAGIGRGYTDALKTIAESRGAKIRLRTSISKLRRPSSWHPAQVIDIWGKPIPRLYAAGEIVGGVHGSNRLGSNATPDYVVFGRIAGTAAAAEKV